MAEFRTAAVEGAQVLWVAGEVDLHNAPELTGHLARLAATGPSSVVVDLSETRYFDSSAVRALVLAGRDPVPLRVVAAPGTTVRSTLAVLGLEEVLSVHDTVAAAAAA